MVVAVVASAQPVFYVSPVGKDTHPGTLEQPFATLQRARDAVRKVNASMQGDIVVHLRGGVYRLAETIEFGVRDSGTGSNRVIYQAYKDEAPVLSGGVEIAGWTPHEKGLWKASAKGLNFRQLYINDARATRARHPNKGDYQRLVLWDMAEKEILVHAAEVGEWRQPKQVEMIVQLAWSEAIMRLDSVRFTGEGAGSWTRASYARVAVQQPERDLVFARDYPPKLANQVYHFENAIEFLDEPGEWYLDRKADLVYYLPRPGEDPRRFVAIAPRVETLVRVRGTLDTPVRGLVFRGLGFEHSTWLRPSEQGHLTGQAMQYNIAPTVANVQYVGRAPAAVLVEAAQGVVFEKNVFRLLGATALDLALGTAETRVVGNAFADIAGNGIAVGVFAHPKTEMHTPYLPADAREICRDDLLADNTILRTGQDFAGTCGIAAGYPLRLTIENNEIAYVPYTGISVGWGWTHEPNAMADNKILRNNVHNVMQLLCDGGGIYTLSRQPGTEIAGNYIHDIVKSKWAGEIPLVAIYLDEGSGGTAEKPIAVRRNLVTTGSEVQRIHLHRSGFTLFEFNPIRISDFNGDQIVEQSGPRPAFRGIKARIAVPPAYPAPTREIVMMTELKDEAEAIKAYDRYHSAEGIWPEMVHAARQSGHEKIRIYRYGNRLVMILTVAEAADLDEMDRRYAGSSARTKAWSELMSGFQRPPPGAEPGQIWVPMKLIHDYERGKAH